MVQQIYGAGISVKVGLSHPSDSQRMSGDPITRDQKEDEQHQFSNHRATGQQVKFIFKYARRRSQSNSHALRQDPNKSFRRQNSRPMVSDGASSMSSVEQAREPLEKRQPFDRRVKNERTDCRVAPSSFAELVRRASHSSASSLSLDRAAERKGIKHTELVERFQIRQVRQRRSASFDQKRNMLHQNSSIEESSKYGNHLPRCSQNPVVTIPSDVPSSHVQSVHPLMIDPPIVEAVQSNGHEPRPHIHRPNQNVVREISNFTTSPWEVHQVKPLGHRFERFLKALVQPMSPLSNSFRVRQLVMMAALSVHIIDFPLEAAFKFSDVGSPVEVVIEIVFVVDFLLMFNTAYVDKRGYLESDRGKIARRYIGSWFLFDMVSSMPIEWMIASEGGIDSERVRFVYDLIVHSPRVLHTIRLLRLAWFHRLDRSEKNVLTWLFYSRYSHLLRIAWVILGLIVVAHYMACCWKLLNASNGNSSILEEYISCFYAVLQLLQGQGVATTTLPQSIFAAIVTLAGSLVLAIVFGNVSVLVSNFNANSTRYQRKMESVYAIMSKLQLPTPVRERIHQYYEHLWREYESLDGEIVAFSKGLSHTLELEVVLFKYMDLITHVPFWHFTAPDFQTQVMLSLHVRIYLPDDYIIRRGEIGDEFYMLNRGICELVLGPDSLETTTGDALDEDCDGNNSGVGSPRTARRSEGYSTARKECYDRVRAPMTPKRDCGTSERDVFPQTRILRRGQMFGELALLMNYERTANVRALSYVEMCILKREDIQRIFVKHPNDRKSVITDLLTRVIESNKVHRVPCPLKAMVQDILPVQEHERVSSMHAALALVAGIDFQQDDPSIKFGIGPSLQQRLRSMNSRDSLPADQRTPLHALGPDQSGRGRYEMSQCRGASTTYENLSDRLHEAMNRIDKLETTQTQMLQLVQSIYAEVHKRRQATTKPSDAQVFPTLDSNAPSVQSLETKLSSNSTHENGQIVSVEEIGQSDLPHLTSTFIHDDQDWGQAIPDSARLPASMVERRPSHSTMLASEALPGSEGGSLTTDPPALPNHHVLKSPVVSPKIRPKQRGRRGSFQGPDIAPARLVPRSSLGELPSPQMLMNSQHVGNGWSDEHTDHIHELRQSRHDVHFQLPRQV